MLRIVALILVLLSSKVFSQEKCNLDKYKIDTSLRVATNKKLIFYSSDKIHYVACYKSKLSKEISALLERKLINPKDIREIGTASGPRKSGSGLWFDEINETWSKQPKYVSFIGSIKVIKQESNKVTYQLKIEPYFDAVQINYEMEFTSDKEVKSYKTIAEFLKEAKLTCLVYTGVDL